VMVKASTVNIGQARAAKSLGLIRSAKAKG